MKNNNKLCSAVNSLMSEKLPEEQIKRLRSEGFRLKSPTRRAALAIALYKKAESGDLSAIKELRAVLEAGREEGTGTKTVVIIDDISKKAD